MSSHQYKLVRDLKDIPKIIEYCKETKYCSFDIETNGEPYHSPSSFITMMSISFQSGFSYCIPLGHSESPFKKKWKKVLKSLVPIFEDYTITKIAQNAKFEHEWFMKYNIPINGRIFDTMLAYHLLDEEALKSLENQVKEFIPEFSEYKDVTEILARKHGWAGIPINILAERNALDADLTLRLMLFYESRLIKANLYNLFRNMSMMQHRVLAESEFKGLSVDRPYLDGLIIHQHQKIEENKTNLLNHPKVKRFERRRRKSRIKELIIQIEEEIEDLTDNQGKDPNARVIKNREEKLSRYIMGDLRTKKELQTQEGLNFNSPTQLIELLFGDDGFRFKIIKYTVDKKTKKETNRPSTDEEVLLALKYKDKSGFLDGLLSHREMEKLYSTYMVGTRKLLSHDEKLHANFKISGTVTGRLSCGEPNLQNIPRSLTSSLIKTMFLPPKGMLLYEADYGQAELRIVAELAKETTMIEIFEKDFNIHVASACKAQGMLDQYSKVKAILKDENHPDHEFWERKKKIAKTINFGILYGQTAKKLSKTLTDATGEKISVEEADEFLKDWLKDYPKVGKWIKHQHNYAFKQGFVKNPFGRKRRLPNIHLKQEAFGLYLEAQRQSVNAVIQGCSSDFTQFSCVLIREKIRNGELPSYLQQLYTVHDSIGFGVKPEDIHGVHKVIQSTMEYPETQKWFGFKMNKVKMKASASVGINWGSLKDYNPDEDYTKWVLP